VHTAIPDYLQRSGRHISSKADVEEAIMVGKKAVEFALKGLSGFMVTINRLPSKNYEVEYKMIELSNVANHTKYLPKEFIGDNIMSVNENFYNYASPLINGEFYPKYKNGIPNYSFFNF
jgi:6-phosphofructokinase 1